jgi:hypothetical protein
MAEQQKLQQQAGGHQGAFIKTTDGKIKKMTKPIEYDFYEGLKNRPIPPEIVPFFPKFYGIELIEGHKYIVMEDLTFGYKQPSIIDIKMGTSSVGEEATPEKRAAMALKDKTTTTVSLGIRVVGARVYSNTEHAFVVKKKDYGKRLTDAQIDDALAFCFSDGKTVRKELLKLYLDKLRVLEKWFSSQHVMRIYSSSLLFVYEGEGNEVKGDIRMIDFAHVSDIHDNGIDDGYLFGLRNLINYFTKLSQ